MTESNYAACCAFVRRQEGGNTDTPGDRGGRTGRGGITHANYDAYRDRKGLPRQDVFQISNAEIEEIYRSEYWNKIWGDRLPAGQDLALFDFAINSGPYQANRARIEAGNADTVTLIKKICAQRLSFMHSLGSWSRFGPGWGRRVSQCEALALRMAGERPSDHVSLPGHVATTAVITGGVIAAAIQRFDGTAIIAVGLMVSVTIIIIAFKEWRARQRNAVLTGHK